MNPELGLGLPVCMTSFFGAASAICGMNAAPAIVAAAPTVNCRLLVFISRFLLFVAMLSRSCAHDLARALPEGKPPGEKSKHEVESDAHQREIDEHRKDA